MTGMAGEPSPVAYERPAVADYGNLLELTAGVGPPIGCEDGTMKAAICSEPPV
jgi:hypothetical protein